jgi:hypothetical protein
MVLEVLGPVGGGRDAWLNAVVKSIWACAATASVMCWVPFTMPGGNPVTEVPGLRPRSPLMTVRPVLVTVVPARTPKLPAVPRPTGAVAATADCPKVSVATAMTPATTGQAASQK